ncbi:MAG: class I SAM-dependent methyltransferase [Hyphomonadaceae bacterium]|nr:class I SAM-dependent methyltransferase [Hyphomonadaceae bacterium]
MTAHTSHTETQCRSCKSEDIGVFLDLGETPLSDRLVDPAKRDEAEPIFPLKVAFCSDCSLVQITETVDPNVLFADKYPYYSSFLPALLAHSKKNVLARIEDRKLNKDSLVIELASNDGYLLKNYVEAGIPVLGIDPADGPPAVAEEIGVPTLNEFFTKDLADKLASDGKIADVIHANNVLAHVADTNGFVAGIKQILKPNGVAVIEAPYLKPLIEHVEFDTIYHEHLCYFSVTALDHLFKRHGLYLNHVEQLSIHGGSLRLFVEPFEAPKESVLGLLRNERDIGMDKPEYFQDFAARVNKLKSSLVTMVRDLKEDKYTVAAYGAAAKGATMLNFCGLTDEDIDFVVDRNTHKQGQLMPGAHLPILAPEALVELKPDYVVILAWNFADEILEQQADYRELGGKFIVPVPSPRVI